MEGGLFSLLVVQERLWAEGRASADLVSGTPLSAPSGNFQTIKREKSEDMGTDWEAFSARE